MTLKNNKLTKTEQKLVNFMSNVIPEFDISYLSDPNSGYTLTGVLLDELVVDKFDDGYLYSRNYANTLFIPPYTDNVWMGMNDSLGRPEHLKTTGEKVDIKQAGQTLDNKGILVIAKGLKSRNLISSRYKKAVIFMDRQGNIRELVEYDDKLIKSIGIDINLDDYLSYWDREIGD